MEKRLESFLAGTYNTNSGNISKIVLLEFILKSEGKWKKII